MFIETGPWSDLRSLFEDLKKYAKEVEGTVYASDDPSIPFNPQLGWVVVPKDSKFPTKRWAIGTQGVKRGRK